MPKKSPSKDLVKDYYRQVFNLTEYFEPLLNEGWGQEEIFKLLKFMQDNQDKVKGKSLEELKKIYLSEKKEQRRY